MKLSLKNLWAVLSVAYLVPGILPASAKSSSSAKPAAIPVQIQYLKTGKEDEATAIKLGEAEIENSNPCVGQMRRELMALQGRKELREAADSISQTAGLDAGAKPLLVLRYMNDAIELRFEMTEPGKDGHGHSQALDTVKYRKGIYLSEGAGTWQERLHADKCHVTEAKLLALVDEIREADRLAVCVLRKRSILDASKKISSYLHTYLPTSWLEEARARLAKENAPATGLLREDTSVYRTGNGTFRECQHGLRILEDDAASSVRVLNAVREMKKGTDVPAQEIDDLEHLLAK